MTYQETLDFLFAQLPMYHRIGAAAYKADLQPTIDLMDALGHPERRFRSIHVAGTNGKGSVSHFLASILQEAGYRVGLYTSPHLVDFRERIRINGQMIPQQEVVDFVEKKLQTPTSALRPPTSDLRPLHLSFFEMTVGLAFDYFAREQVDIAVIEVGMGGRLDSTNVMPPLNTEHLTLHTDAGGVVLSVITNIGLDHTQFLGDTLEKIAAEKAGIIKPHVPVVIGETQPETAPVFLQTAAAHQAPITFADQHYRVDEEPRTRNQEMMTYRVETLDSQHPTFNIQSQLTGEYQKKNIATVLQAVEVLRQTKHLTLKTEHLLRGLARVVTNTHLHGRWQKIGESPLTICETAHNEPGIRAMLQGVNNTPHRNLHIIYGCVNDKDYSHILQFLNSDLRPPTSDLRLPTSDLTWYFSQPSVPRGLPVDDLQAAAAAIGIHGQAYPRVGQAITAARKAAQPDDLVLVTGSIFLVADALAFTNSGEVCDR